MEVATKPYKPSRWQLAALASVRPGQNFRTWSKDLREWAVLGGYTESSGNTYIGNRRTSKPVPTIHRPYHARQGVGPFPWGVREHWRVLSGAGYHLRVNVRRQLLGTSWDQEFNELVAHPRQVFTRTSLGRLRDVLFRVLNGEPPCHSERFPDWVPVGLRRPLLTGRDIRMLCCELLLEPVFEAGTLVRFDAMDPEVAFAELQQLIGPGTTPRERYLAFTQTQHG